MNQSSVCPGETSKWAFEGGVRCQDGGWCCTGHRCVSVEEGGAVRMWQRVGVRNHQRSSRLGLRGAGAQEGELGLRRWSASQQRQMVTKAPCLQTSYCAYWRLSLWTGRCLQSRVWFLEAPVTCALKLAAGTRRTWHGWRNSGSSWPQSYTWV